MIAKFMTYIVCNINISMRKAEDYYFRRSFGALGMYVLKDGKGLQVDDIQIQDGGIIVNISIKNVDDNLGTNKFIVAGK
jgi:hypothetical protein